MLLLITGGLVLGLHLSAQYGAVTGDVAKWRDVMHLRSGKVQLLQGGSHEPSTEVLGWLERGAVRKIVFMHCSAFTMPPIIREFPSLMGVELWNTTLVEWGEEAAVSAELHPMMLFTLFVYLLLQLGVVKNPLRELPQARSTNFDVSYLALEFTLLTEVPAWIKANVWDAVLWVVLRCVTRGITSLSLRRMSCVGKMKTHGTRLETNAIRQSSLNRFDR
ncbi:hypothetical protein GQ600_22717 [Phytophthora cactorum]|nr:hypothetical protein GQ600_22717 [Phytophthora cactorum]